MPAVSLPCGEAECGRAALHAWPLRVPWLSERSAQPDLLFTFLAGHERAARESVRSEDAWKRVALEGSMNLLAISLDGPATYWQLGNSWILVSVPNFIMIMIMLALFVLALVLPFPGGKDES